MILNRPGTKNIDFSGLDKIYIQIDGLGTESMLPEIAGHQFGGQPDSACAGARAPEGLRGSFWTAPGACLALPGSSGKIAGGFGRVLGGKY